MGAATGVAHCAGQLAQCWRGDRLRQARGLGSTATTEGLPVFHTVHAPTATALQALLNRIIKRIMTFLMRKGFLIEEQDMTYLTDTDPDLVLGRLQAAASQKLLSLQTVPTQEAQPTPRRCASEQGFSPHAEVCRPSAQEPESQGRYS